MAGEKNFENRVKRFLTDSGCWYIKYWGGAAYTKSGVPDLLVCINGYFLGLEIKAEHGRPSKLQIMELRRIVGANGIAGLLYPKDFEEFKDFCKAVIAGEDPAEIIMDYNFTTEWWDKYVKGGNDDED